MTSARRDPATQDGTDPCWIRSNRESIFKILAAGCPAGITRQESEHEDPEEEEDDRVNGDLEGKHGDRPASVTAPSSYEAMFGRHDAQPSSGSAIGVD